MFGTLGGPELLLILVIALIVFGPRKLPEIGKSMGKMMAEFRRASNDFKRTIEEEVEADRARTALEEPRPEAPPAIAPPPGTVAQETASGPEQAAPAPPAEPSPTPIEPR
jgi:TatA/E family protein of Tat protein translocase